MEPALRASRARIARAVRRAECTIGAERGDSLEAAARNARYAVAGRGARARRSAGHRAASGRPGRDAVASAAPRGWRSGLVGDAGVRGVRRPAASRGRCSTVTRADRSGRAASATALGRGPHQRRHALLAQLPAPSVHAADSRALAGRGPGASRAARHTWPTPQRLLNERRGPGPRRACRRRRPFGERLRALPVARRRNALRAFIARAGLEMPEASRLKEMSGPLLAARADAQPEVRWAGARHAPERGRLELQEVKRKPSQIEFIAKSWRWQTDRRLILEQVVPSSSSMMPRAPSISTRLPDVARAARRAGWRERCARRRARARERSSRCCRTRRFPSRSARACRCCSRGSSLIAAGDRWIDASVAATVKSRRRARLEI